MKRLYNRGRRYSIISPRSTLQSASVPFLTELPLKTRWVGLTWCIFYIFSLQTRSNFSVSTTTIISHLHLTPVRMGTIISAFGLSYAALQIASAIWVRRYVSIGS